MIMFSNHTISIRMLFAETIVLAMAALSPWAFGAVDAWAQLILFVALVVLTLVLTGTRSRLDWRARLLCLPSLGLASLSALAYVQSVSLPVPLLKMISPQTHTWRSGLAPSLPEVTLGKTLPPVGTPASTVSHEPDSSLRNAAQLAAAWLLFQAVLRLDGRYRMLGRFALITITNGALLTLFAVVQALSWSGKIYGIRTVPQLNGWLTGGPFVTHNSLAAYLNMAFGLALGVLLATLQERGNHSDLQRSRGSRFSVQPTPPSRETSSRLLWAASICGLIFTGLIASHSRGGFLAMAVATTVTLMVLQPRSLRLGMSLAAMLAITLLFLVATGSTSAFQRLATLTDPSQLSFVGRLQVWGVALRLWKSFPVLGAGLGTFPAASAPFYHKSYLGFYFAHVENEYLHVLAEGGLVGFGFGLIVLAGIVKLTRRAYAAASDDQQRALMLGAISGGLALLIQCLSDFPLHIPGVAVSAVILAAHSCRIGMSAEPSNLQHKRMPGNEFEDDSEFKSARVETPTLRNLGAWASDLFLIALGGLVLLPGIRLARAESVVRRVGLPYPGLMMPSVDQVPTDGDELRRVQAALIEALRLRPDWAEGYLRLGLIEIGLYSNLTSAWLGNLQEGKIDAITSQAMSNPLWLHRVVHNASAAELAANGGLLDHEPVKNYLVPATRCFLEAHRCSPDLALSHARLAELDYLVDHGESTSTHAARALRLAGYDYLILNLAGVAAAQAGDLDLAAKCWRKALITHEVAWREIVPNLVVALTPEQILEKVIPDGARLPLLFAEQLYATPEWSDTRALYLRTALARLPGEHGLIEAERLWTEGKIRAGLGEVSEARKLMVDALQADSTHPEWRSRADQLARHLGRPGRSGPAGADWPDVAPGRSRDSACQAGGDRCHRPGRLGKVGTETSLRKCAIAMIDLWRAFERREWFGVPSLRWAAVLCLTASLLLVGRLVVSIARTRLGRTGVPNGSSAPPYLLRLLNQTTTLSLLAIAVLLTLTLIDLGPAQHVVRALRAFALLVIFFQVGRWGNALLDLVLERGFAAAKLRESTARTAFDVVRFLPSAPCG